MHRDWDVRCVHIFREHNRVIGLMAKRSLEHERGLRVFDRPPVVTRPPHPEGGRDEHTESP